MKLTLNIPELIIKSKIKNKKILSVFSGGFLRNLVGGSIAFLITLTGAFWKNKFGKPCTRYYRKFETFTRYLHIGVHKILICSLGCTGFD